MGWLDDFLEDPIGTIFDPIEEATRGINDFIFENEKYIPAAVGWATGQPWIPAAWGVANQPSNTQAGAGLTSIASYYGGKGLSSLFGGGDTYQNSFDSGEMAKAMDSTPTFNVMDAASSYLGDHSMGDSLSDSLSNMFGDPTVATPFTGGNFSGSPVNWWEDYNSVANPVNTFGPSMSIPSAANADIGLSQASGGGGWGGSAGGAASDPLANTGSSTFDTTVNVAPTSVDTQNVFGTNETGSVMDTSLYGDQPTLEGITDNVGSNMDSSFYGPATNPSPVTTGIPNLTDMTQIPKGTNMGLGDLFNEGLDYVKNNPMKTAMNAYKLYGGYKANERADELVKQMDMDRQAALSKADPMAQYREAAGSEYLRRLKDPSIGVNERINQAGAAMDKMARDDANAGRRSRIPITRSNILASILPGSDLSMFDPAKFGSGNTANVYSQFAAPMAAARAQQGGGLAAAMSSIGQDYDNYKFRKRLEDVFSQYPRSA